MTTSTGPGRDAPAHAPGAVPPRPRHTAPPGGALPPGRRWAIFLAGWVLLALGAAGTVLPLLPATPLLLLALWAFSASSERFHRWLWEHRVFGPMVHSWRRDRVIPLRAKVVAIASMVASLLYVGLVRRSPAWVIAAMVAVMVPGLVFILRFPSRRPQAGGTARG